MRHYVLLAASLYILVASSMSVRMGNKISKWHDADKLAEVGVSKSYAINARNMNVVMLLSAIAALLYSMYRIAPSDAKEQVMGLVS